MLFGLVDTGLVNMLGNHDILTETATANDKSSLNYRSGSGKYRCSVYGHAYIPETTTFPDGTVKDHARRIYEEMQSTPSQSSLLDTQCQHHNLLLRVSKL